MPSFRSIVAATDFSDFSERVVQRAAHLAKQHQAELHLIHVVRPLDLYPGMTLAPDEFGHHDEELLQAEQSRLDAMATSLASQLSIRVHAATRLGRAHAEIASYAREISADLVVAGARGENTLMNLFLGATAARLLQVATCPVLIVRNPAGEPYRQVLAAVDFSPISAAVVAHAVLLAGDAPVQALHVLGTEVEQRMRRAKSDQVDITGWLAGQRGEAEKKLDALLAQIENSDADLAVLGRHGHGGGLQEWLLGSVSKDVALAAACDVLLIEPGQ